MEEYGEFGLQTPPQPVLSHPVYTPEDFQDSEDDDAVLLRRGEVTLPSITRHQRYIGSSYNKAISGGQRCGRFTGHSQCVEELHDVCNRQEQNCNRFENIGRANQNAISGRQGYQVAAKGHQLSAHCFESEGQSLFAKGQGHPWRPGYPERGEGYGPSVAEVSSTGAMMTKGKLDNHEYDELTIGKDHTSHLDQWDCGIRQHECLAQQTTSSDRGCPDRSSYSARLSRLKRENTLTRLPHKQGQVFAWPVMPRRNEVDKSAVGNNSDVILPEQSGDEESQDSKSRRLVLLRVKQTSFLCSVSVLLG